MIFDIWHDAKYSLPRESGKVLIYIPCDCKCLCDICYSGDRQCQLIIDKHKSDFHGVQMGIFEKRFDAVYINKSKGTESTVYTYKFHPVHPTHWINLPKPPENK